MKYFSMFSGVGGFEKGIGQAYENREQESIRERTIRNDLQPRGIVRGSNERGKQSQSEERHRIFNGVCVGYSEVDKYAIQIYQRHFPTHRNFGDARTIKPADIPDFDLLCGGFPRRLTPIECARLQGFPDNWHKGLSDTQAYKCYGNAVSVPVIEFLIERIFLANGNK
jgi:site-specific DNA-cytosine methylase